MKTSEPEDEQLCIVVHTINNNICNTDPLYNSTIQTTGKVALPFITWDVIWDCKNETGNPIKQVDFKNKDKKSLKII